jgi:hypothetical protein
MDIWLKRKNIIIIGERGWDPGPVDCELNGALISAETVIEGDPDFSWPLV